MEMPNNIFICKVRIAFNDNDDSLSMLIHDSLYIRYIFLVVFQRKCDN